MWEIHINYLSFNWFFLVSLPRLTSSFPDVHLGFNEKHFTPHGQNMYSIFKFIIYLNVSTCVSLIGHLHFKHCSTNTLQYIMLGITKNILTQGSLTTFLLRVHQLQYVTQVNPWPWIHKKTPFADEGHEVQSKAYTTSEIKTELLHVRRSFIL